MRVHGVGGWSALEEKDETLTGTYVPPLSPGPLRLPLVHESLPGTVLLRARSRIGQQFRVFVVGRGRVRQCARRRRTSSFGSLREVYSRQ